MKLLLFSLLLAGAGAGGYRLVRDEVPAAQAAEVAPRECTSSDCRVTVERVSESTCLVTCYDADGSVVCKQEVACDASCEEPCDRPCDKAAQAKAAGSDCATPCQVPSSCKR